MHAILRQLTVLGGVLAAGAVYGDEPAKDATQLGAVTVTGEKLGRSVADTASSVSVSTGLELERIGDQDVYDLLRRVGNTASTGFGEFSIRGVSNTGAYSNSQAQPVSTIFVDGVALDSTAQQAGALNTYDVEQIEVLRGPQSTTQGRNSLAGAIVLRSRAPELHGDAPPELDVRGQLGSRGYSQIGMAGGGVLMDGLGFRISGIKTGDHGNTTNITLGDSHWNASDQGALRAAIGYQPAFVPGLEFMAHVQTSRRKQNGNGSSFEAEGDYGSHTSTSNVASEYRYIANLYSLDSGYRINASLKLTATTATMRTALQSLTDYDSTAADGGYYTNDEKGRNFSQELRLNFTDWHGLNGLVGAYYGRFDNEGRMLTTDYYQTLQGVLPVAVPTTTYIQADYDQSDSSKVRNHALFTEFDYALTAALTLTAGLRYDHESRDTQAPFAVTRADLIGCTAALAPVFGLADCTPPVDVLPAMTAAGLVPSAGDQLASATYHAFLPKLGLRYRYSERYTAFATAARAYRAGGAEVNYATGDITQYKPEYTNNYELGLRSTWLNNRLAVKLNTYYIDWTDQQVAVRSQTATVSSPFYTANAGSSTLYGSELEAQWQVARWSVTASVGYAHTRFDTFESNGVDYSGKEFPNAPHMTAGLAAYYRTRSGWFAAPSIGYTGAYFITPDNTSDSRSDAYTLLGLRAGYDKGRVSAYVFGRNLLDQDYALSRYAMAALGARTQNGQYVNYGAPLTVGAGVEFRL